MPSFVSSTPDSTAKLTVSSHGRSPMIEVENTQGETIAVKLNARDAADYADAVLKATAYIPEAKITPRFSLTPEHYRVGTGSTQARVNVPDSDTQALRNLNFAVANLRAYVEWVAGSKERADKEAEELMLLAVNSRGLRVFNALNSSDYKSWAEVPGNNPDLRDKWKLIAEDAVKADRERKLLDATKLSAPTINTATDSIVSIQRGLNGRSVADLLDWAPRVRTHPGY